MQNAETSLFHLRFHILLYKAKHMPKAKTKGEKEWVGMFVQHPFILIFYPKQEETKSKDEGRKQK